MSFKTVPLGSVARIVNGGTPDTKVAAYWDGGIAWLTPKDMGKSSDPVTRQTSRTLSAAGLDNCSARLVPPRSVILSTRAPIGHLAINDVQIAFNQGCRGLVPSDRVDTKFLYYFLFANVGLLNDLGTGTTFKELSAGALAKVPMPLPALPEQQRIVAILDEAFEGLAQVATIAGRYKTAAIDLFKVRTSELMTGGDEWVSRTLGEICTLQRGFDLPVQDRKSGSVPLISSSGPIAFQSIAPVKGPGVVTGRSGSIGKVFWVSEGYWPLNTTLYVKDFHGNDPRFVFRLLQNFDLKRFAGGAGVPTLNRNSVHGEEVRIPPSALEQQRVASAIDCLEVERDQMCALAESKLALVAQLKESLLARAFSGDLTAQAANDNAFATPEQVANILAIIHWRHERARREKTYGHVKAQKALHLVECVGRVELGRNPIKDAAGPNDFAHMKQAEAWAKENGFFEFVQREAGYDFKKLTNHGRLLAAAKEAVQPIAGAIERVSDLIVSLDSEMAEVLATVHAAWNNLLASGQEASPDAIVREARDDWHPNKMQIAENKFRDAIRLIKSKGIVPDGTSRPVLHLQPTLL